MIVDMQKTVLPGIARIHSVVIQILLLSLTGSLLTGNPAYAQKKEEGWALHFQTKSVWIQIGNQIRDVDEPMIRKMKEYGIERAVLIPSTVTDKGYFPKLSGIVERCHQAGIRVSMGGITFKDTYVKGYWEKYPELRRRNRDGGTQTKSPHRYQLCPNNPINHQYMASFLVRQAERFRVDEIHIDYEMGSCYCDYCRADFQKTFGQDPKELPTDDLRWLEWRSEKTRLFFEALRRKMDEAGLFAGISMTAPVLMKHPYTDYDTAVKYEKLTLYTDIYEPMIYVYSNRDPEVAGEQYAAIRRRLLGKTVAAGIQFNDELARQVKSAERLRCELESVRRQGAVDLTIFEIRYINEENGSLLKDQPGPMK